MSKTTEIVLKEDYRKLSTLDKVIELDSYLQYFVVPKSHPLVEDMRNRRCNNPSCKRCAKLPFEHLKMLKELPITAKLENGGIFLLNQQHLQKIHEYMGDIKVQYYPRNVLKLSYEDPIPVLDVYSSRFAPINLRNVYDHLVATFEKPVYETNYRGLGIMVQFRNLNLHFEGIREGHIPEIVNWQPTVLLSYNFGEKSFLYGFVAGVVFCENQMFIPSFDNQFGIGSKGMIRHTSGNIERFDLQKWTNSWLNSLHSIEKAMKDSMLRKVNEVYEILYYYKTAQNKAMLLEFFTRPQDIYTTAWDLAMNVTYVGSPKYEPIFVKRYTKEHLFLSGKSASKLLYEQQFFRFKDLVGAISKIENSWDIISTYSDKMKVNFSKFYDFASDVLNDRAYQLKNRSRTELIEVLNKPLQLLPEPKISN